MLDGVVGLDDGLVGVFGSDFVTPVDCLAISLFDDLEAEAELGAGFLLAALAGVLAILDGVLEADLTGVLESCCSGMAPVKLCSFMGETEDLLLESDFLAEAADRLVVDARFLLVDADVVRFFIGVGVPLLFGRGVPFIGLELRFAGVVVCLAILYQIDCAIYLEVFCSDYIYQSCIYL